MELPFDNTSTEKPSEEKDFLYHTIFPHLASVVVGQSLAVTCLSINATVKWTHNGLPLKSNNRVRVKLNNLILFRIQVQDGGIVGCIRDERNGSVVYNTELRVFGELNKGLKSKYCKQRCNYSFINYYHY